MVYSKKFLKLGAIKNRINWLAFCDDNRVNL